VAGSHLITSHVLHPRRDDCGGGAEYQTTTTSLELRPHEQH
jgi:hypothetical protein